MLHKKIVQVIDDLKDVDITGVLDEQVLAYESATGKWLPDTVSRYVDPMTTRGDLLYRNSSNITDRLAVGTATQVVQSDGTDVSWQTLVASDISDFDTEVSNNTDVFANTTHRTSDGTQHTYIDQDLRTTASPTFASLTSIDYIDFDLAVTPTVQEGRMFWDTNNKTVSIGMPGGNVILQVGQEGLIEVRNISGSLILNGKLVYATGASANRLTIDEADNTDADTIQLLGIATEDIANNSNGYVAQWGTVRGSTTQPINTSSYAPGTKLYLSTSGNWTSTHPSSPTDATIIIGSVRRQHATEGEIVIQFSYFTIGNNYNGTMRQSVINKSTGTSAAAGFSAVNDAGHRVTLTMFGSNYTPGPEVAGIYNEGYGSTFNIVDGNETFAWFTDPTDSHNFSALTNQVMELNAAGDLTLFNGQFVSSIVTGTAPLDVTSTTLNTNFNADYLDDQHGTYYLARANHTGTQLSSTISDFDATVAAGYLPRSAWYGTFAESFDARVTSNGTTITMSLEQSGGGDLSMQFSDAITTLDCDPTPKTIALTAGTLTSPQANYIYIPQSTKVLTKSTSAWPGTEHIKVGFFYCQTAVKVQADGPLINQNWNDHLAGTDDMGHITHIGRWIRSVGAKWFSGCDGGGTSGYLTLGGGGGTFQVNAGVISQMHKHTFGAKDTSSGDDIHVWNYPSAAYTEVTNLNQMLVDSQNVSLTNRYYNLILAGVANKSGEYAPLLITLPAGSYNTATSAINDSSNYDDYSLPREFTKESSTAFLIARITLRNQSDTTFTVLQTQDLRGLDSATAGGSLSGGTITNFPDSDFTIYNNVDATKAIDFDLSGLSTASTWTITPADAAMTLFSTAQYTDLTDAVRNIPI
jgi:hypothetical protein